MSQLFRIKFSFGCWDSEKIQNDGGKTKFGIKTKAKLKSQIKGINNYTSFSNKVQNSSE
jgi:hypothetical protein